MRLHYNAIMWLPHKSSFLPILMIYSTYDDFVELLPLTFPNVIILMIVKLLHPFLGHEAARFDLNRVFTN